MLVFDSTGKCCSLCSLHIIIGFSFRSATDSCLYLVREPDPNALTTSFDELKLFEHQAADVVSVSLKILLIL